MKKTVVITGSTRGIGLGMAKEFLSRGHNVVITGTSEESVARGLKDIGENSNVIGVPCLVENTDSIEKVWDKAIERFSTVDVWINNAGVATSRNGLEELSYDEIKRTIDTNLTGTILATRIVSSRMLKQGSGQIYMFEGLAATGSFKKASVFMAPQSVRSDISQQQLQMNLRTHLLSLDQSVPASLRLTCCCVHQNPARRTGKRLKKF